MQSCVHNGFGCPYCRTAMADIPEDDDETHDQDQEPSEAEQDFALRGFRFFFNNLDGVEHDREDVLEEQEDMEDGAEDDVIPHPTADQVTQELQSQGITMQHLVSVLLIDHEEYDEEEEEFDDIAEDVWGKMRIIITNYQQQQERQEEQQKTQVQTQQQPEPQQQTQQEQEPEQAPTTAEPKHPNVTVRRREIMSHV